MKGDSGNYSLRSSRLARENCSLSVESDFCRKRPSNGSVKNGSIQQISVIDLVVTQNTEQRKGENKLCQIRLLRTIR